MSAFGRKKAARDREQGLQRALGEFDASAESQFLPAGLSAQNVQAGLLGLGDQAQSDAALNAFLQSSGFNRRLQEGQRAITNNAAARGELGSGATLAGLTRFGQNLASDEFANFFDQTGQIAERGLGVAQRRNALATGGILSNAEQRAQSRGALARGITGAAVGAINRLF